MSTRVWMSRMSRESAASGYKVLLLHNRVQPGAFRWHFKRRLHGALGSTDVLQSVAGNQGHNACATAYDPFLDRAAHAGDGGRGSRFGKNASQTSGIAHCVQDLLIAYVDHR